MHLLECLFFPLRYIFNSVNKQAARIIHTTAKSAAMVVAEIAQAGKINVYTMHFMINDLLISDFNSKGELIEFE
jgi:hypothetical protein